MNILTALWTFRYPLTRSADENLHKHRYKYYSFIKKIQINYSNLKKTKIKKWQ